MIAAVISVLGTQRHIGTSLLPKGAHVEITGAGRVYLCYLYDEQRGRDLCFTDPIDNEILIEQKYFDTELQAREWISADIRLRNSETRGVH